MSLKLVLLYKKRKTYDHGINPEYKSSETTLPHWLDKELLRENCSTFPPPHSPPP